MSRPTTYRFDNGKGDVINSQTANYSLTPDDNGATVVITSGTAKTLTVPALLPIGFTCRIVRGGAGTLAVAASGTTLNSAGGLLNVSAQYGVALIQSIGADIFIVSGDLV